VSDSPFIHVWQGLIIYRLGCSRACVTAFIIERYQSLQQDQWNTSKCSLLQISTPIGSHGQWLVNKYLRFFFQRNNLPSDAVGLALQWAFWFLSLAFSLACALSATLVQQWSRYYLQAIEPTICSTPSCTSTFLLTRRHHHIQNDSGSRKLSPWLPTYLIVPFFLAGWSSS